MITSSKSSSLPSSEKLNKLLLVEFIELLRSVASEAVFLESLFFFLGWHLFMDIINLIFINFRIYFGEQPWSIPQKISTH